MNRLVLLVLLVLAACAGEPRQAQRTKPVDSAQCFRQLDRIKGVRYRRVPDRVAGPACGLKNAVELIDIGVPVRGIGPVSCPVAAGLARWSATVREAADNHLDSPVTGIDSMGSYACRPRNGMAGGAMSEHASANAVDISAFRLADGRRITVKGGWDGKDRKARRFLRDLHKQGCAQFNMVLGPEANAQHRDHFHFDMGGWKDCE